MSATKQIACHLMFLGMLPFLSSCQESSQCKDDLKIQGKPVHPYLEELVKTFGPPTKVRLKVRDGSQYDSADLNKDKVNRLWRLLATSPSWYETATTDDYYRGTGPSCLVPLRKFEFTLSSASRRTSVRFEIFDKTAMIFVENKGGIDLLDISETAKSIANLISDEESRADKIKGAGAN